MSNDARLFRSNLDNFLVFQIFILHNRSTIQIFHYLQDFLMKNTGGTLVVHWQYTDSTLLVHC